MDRRSVYNGVMSKDTVTILGIKVNLNLNYQIRVTVVYPDKASRCSDHKNDWIDTEDALSLLENFYCMGKALVGYEHRDQCCSGGLYPTFACRSYSAFFIKTSIGSHPY